MSERIGWVGDRPLLAARLDRRNEFVLCGPSRCTSRIAQIVGEGVWRVRTIPGQHLGPDGVWRFSKYARQRIAKGKRPKNHRGVGASFGASSNRPLGGKALPALEALGIGLPANTMQAAPYLKEAAVFACPREKCGAFTLVDPARLLPG